jgi:hypothetical protein
MQRLENIILIGTALATSAIVKNRFIGYTDATPAAGAACKGVAEDNAAIGETVGVKARGWLLVEAGAAVAVGAKVQTDNLGRAITLAGGEVEGRALDAATAAGQLIRVDR